MSREEALRRKVQDQAAEIESLKRALARESDLRSRAQRQMVLLSSAEGRQRTKCVALEGKVSRLERAAAVAGARRLEAEEEVAALSRELEVVRAQHQARGRREAGLTEDVLGRVLGPARRALECAERGLMAAADRESALAERYCTREDPCWKEVPADEEARAPTNTDFVDPMIEAMGVGPREAERVRAWVAAALDPQSRAALLPLQLRGVSARARDAFVLMVLPLLRARGDVVARAWTQDVLEPSADLRVSVEALPKTRSKGSVAAQLRGLRTSRAESTDGGVGTGARGFSFSGQRSASTSDASRVSGIMRRFKR